MILKNVKLIWEAVTEYKKLSMTANDPSEIWKKKLK